VYAYNVLCHLYINLSNFPLWGVKINTYKTILGKHFSEIKIGLIQLIQIQKVTYFHTQWKLVDSNPIFKQKLFNSILKAHKKFWQVCSEISIMGNFAMAPVPDLTIDIFM